jgi:hypothetical protein
MIITFFTHGINEGVCLLKELLGHVLELAISEPDSSISLSIGGGASLEHLLELVDALHRILPVVFSLVVMDSSQNDLRLILWSQYLDEGMLMAESLLTHLAVVEVLADAALVSDA